MWRPSKGACGSHDEVEKEEVDLWTGYVCFFRIMCIAWSVETWSVHL
jgi:hypothetical protein